MPVVRFEGTDLEATAFAIADNKTHDFSTWDEGARVEWAGSWIGLPTHLPICWYL